MLEEPDPTNPLSKLFRELPPEQRAEAIYNFERYLEVVLRIVEENGTKSVDEVR